MIRTLIIEDNATTSLVTEAFLKECGYDVRIARCAEEAFRVSAEFSPHFIISDWNVFDELSGIEICAILQRHNPRAGIILVSGYDRNEVAAKAISSGLQPIAVLQKPIEFDALLEALDTEMSFAALAAQ